MERQSYLTLNVQEGLNFPAFILHISLFFYKCISLFSYRMTHREVWSICEKLQSRKAAANQRQGMSSSRANQREGQEGGESMRRCHDAHWLGGHGKAGLWLKAAVVSLSINMTS